MHALSRTFAPCATTSVWVEHGSFLRALFLVLRSRCIFSSGLVTNTFCTRWIPCGYVCTVVRPASALHMSCPSIGAKAIIRDRTCHQQYQTKQCILRLPKPLGEWLHEIERTHCQDVLPTTIDAGRAAKLENVQLTNQQEVLWSRNC